MLRYAPEDIIRISEIMPGVFVARFEVEKINAFHGFAVSLSMSTTPPHFVQARDITRLVSVFITFPRFVCLGHQTAVFL